MTQQAHCLRLTNGPAACSKAATKEAIWGETHEALRLDRTEPAHCPYVHGGKGHRDAEADRRFARWRKPARGALERNPHGQMPTLELDDGSYLSEITAICEYLEEKKPSPPMIGATAEQRAECRMWTRRVDLNIAEPLANGYRFGEALKFFEKRIPVAPDASPGLKKIAANRLQWPNGQMAGKNYLCGKRFTLADILLYCWLDFGNQVGQPLDPANTNIAAWFARVGERPSVKA